MRQSVIQFHNGKHTAYQSTFIYIFLKLLKYVSLLTASLSDCNSLNYSQQSLCKIVFPSPDYL